LPTFLVFSPLFATAVVVGLIDPNRRRQALATALACGIGAGMSAFYVIPALGELHLTRISELTSNYFELPSSLRCADAMIPLHVGVWRLEGRHERPDVVPDWRRSARRDRPKAYIPRAQTDIDRSGWKYTRSVYEAAFVEPGYFPARVRTLPPPGIREWQVISGNASVTTDLVTAIRVVMTVDAETDAVVRIASRRTRSPGGPRRWTDAPGFRSPMQTLVS
jgi:hypothetical protein